MIGRKQHGYFRVFTFIVLFAEILSLWVPAARAVRDSHDD